MSNQTIMWIILILPWTTLFFMKKDDVKRFMPTALVSSIYTIILVLIGGKLSWWGIKETLYPLNTLPNLFSLNPVGTIWIFKFTYNRFWLYLATDIVANIMFAYGYLGYFLTSREIFQFANLGPLHVLIIHIIAGVLLYCYQIWQESIFAFAERKSVSPSLQPIATKPLPKDEKGNDDE